MGELISTDCGYVKIHRKILEWGWYKDINTFRLFIHMLLKANWKEGKFKGTTVPRGSFVSSYPRLAEECGLTINELRTALRHLKSTGEVVVRTNNKYSIFTVNNNCKYQDDNSQADSQNYRNNILIIAHFPAGRKGKMKKVIEMAYILTEMDTDAYMQCKYILSAD